MSARPVTCAETKARLARDRQRLLERLRAAGTPTPLCLLSHPSYLAVWLHRWSHYLHERGFGRLGRLLWHANLMLTGADIAPGADLGAGLLLLAPAAVSLVGTAGQDLTVGALAGLGGEVGEGNVGAGLGVPALGDEVTLEVHSGVLGAVRIGHRVRIRAGCIATFDVPDGAEVGAPHPPRVFVP